MFATSKIARFMYFGYAFFKYFFYCEAELTILMPKSRFQACARGILPDVERLLELPGVREASVERERRMAYLKVNLELWDEEDVRRLLDAPVVA